MYLDTMSYSAKDKLKIIKYSYKYGIDKTIEALSLDSNYKLSKRTICRWRNKWNQSCIKNRGNPSTSFTIGTGGHLFDLSDKTKKPKKYRQRQINGQILQFIQQIRLQYPTLGKDKLKVLTDNFVKESNNDKQDKQSNFPKLKTISNSTIGRILTSFKEQRIIPNWTTKQSKKVGLNGSTGKLTLRIIKRKKKKNRRKDYKPDNPGDLVQIDCITYIINRVRRYLICAVDLKSRFSFTYGYNTLSSSTAKDFLIKFQQVFPYQIKHIQTDNGQEFHKHFQNYLKTQDIIQFWNYPRSPKQNAFIERFNRTIQEEYANYKQWDLKDDLNKFNKELMDYLIFYNFSRPHLGLKKDCGQFISPMQYLKQYHRMCHMWWTGTKP